jgi:hypothetical protein
MRQLLVIAAACVGARLAAASRAQATATVSAGFREAYKCLVHSSLRDEGSTPAAS